MREIDCRDLDGILAGDGISERLALDEHARNCRRCAKEIREWDDLSALAGTLSEDWDSRDLWISIRGRAERESRSNVRQVWFGIGRHRWQMASAAMLGIALSLALSWAILRAPDKSLQQAEQRLMTEDVLSEVEATQRAYVAAIDRLASLAESKLAASESPIIVSYREKLIVLDEAIAECNESIRQNRYNRQVRQQLLAMYREKQNTLHEVLQEDADVQ